MDLSSDMMMRPTDAAPDAPPVLAIVLLTAALLIVRIVRMVFGG